MGSLIVHAISLLLVYYAYVAGEHLNRKTTAGLVFLILCLFAAQSSLREKNVFELVGLPVLEEPYELRSAIRAFERAGHTAEAKVLKGIVDDKVRSSYIKHGMRGLIVLQNPDDTAEFVVKVLGPTLLWYLEAIIVICMVHFSRKRLGVFQMSVLVLFLLAMYEAIIRATGENMFSKKRTSTTAFDSAEFARTLYVCGFAVYTFLKSAEWYDRDKWSLEAATRVAELGKALLKVE